MEGGGEKGGGQRGRVGVKGRGEHRRIAGEGVATHGLHGHGGHTRRRPLHHGRVAAVSVVVVARRRGRRVSGSRLHLHGSRHLRLRCSVDSKHAHNILIIEAAGPRRV